MDANIKNYKGGPRRYGLEIEYAGLPVEASARIAADILKGQIRHDYKTHYTIHTETYGDFIVELDVEIAQKISQKAKAKKEQDPHGFSLETVADKILPEVLQSVAPTEIVSPPLTYDQIDIMQELVSALHQNGAMGTGKSLFYAFGYHVNPEVRSLDAADILDTIRSFIVCYDWLCDTLHMDITRRLSGFAGPWDKDYIEMVLSHDYSPDIDGLVRDYVRCNPTRNHALDLMPLFSFVNKDLMKTLVTDERIKARPTWHFRMPNCLIDDPGWSVWQGIRCWNTVETLAANPGVLHDLCRSHATRKPDLMSGTDPAWIKTVASRLEGLA